jgi:acyl-CoA reductase-like NAD-dependent aldehyde dehydrogenase
MPGEGIDRDQVMTTILDARKAQRAWAATPLRERVRIVRQARRLIAERAAEFAEASGQLRGRPVDETLTAEVLPLLEAHRFAEKSAAEILRIDRLGPSGRPLWLSGVSTEIVREPRGVVLIVGPRNYPLMLPGIQLLQALVAGNAVLLKPAPGCTRVADRLATVWREARLPRHLLQVLPEDSDAVHECINAGVDFLVLTGSASTGDSIYRACAEKMTPATMELSGSDCAIIRDDANAEMAAAALAFGLRLNAGETCIAPRRAFVARRIGERVEAHLVHQLEQHSNYPAPDALAPKLDKLLAAVAERGGSVIAGGRVGDCIELPLVISGKTQVAELVNEELFGSVLVMTFVDTDEEALSLSRKSPFSLGATVFSNDTTAAKRIARQLNAGVVVINDMIVPTADPRIPFGGSGRSGFGVTRGAEGLLAMTVPKVVTVTSGTQRRHFLPVGAGAADLFTGYIQLVHGRWRGRWAAFKRLCGGVRNLQSRQSSPDQPDQHEQ